MILKGVTEWVPQSSGVSSVTQFEQKTYRKEIAAESASPGGLIEFFQTGLGPFAEAAGRAVAFLDYCGIQRNVVRNEALFTRNDLRAEVC